jgi:hydrogenase/urease accessory protein HupE
MKGVITDMRKHIPTAILVAIISLFLYGQGYLHGQENPVSQPECIRRVR